MVVPGKDAVDWTVADSPVDYPMSLADMTVRAEAIRAGQAAERVWLVEHPALYTAGTSAVAAELLDARFPVFVAGRGGRHTYHGPGQRVGYVQLDLTERGRDIRAFVHALEQWVIAALGEFGVEAWSVDGRVGIWTIDAQDREAKIGAIGVRVRRWVTLHGFSLNIDPDLSHFSGIVPCGLPDFPVTSLAALGIPASLSDFDAALAKHFESFLFSLVHSRYRSKILKDGQGADRGAYNAGPERE